MTGPEAVPSLEQEAMNVPHVVVWYVHRLMSHERRQQHVVKPGEWFRVAALDETVEGVPLLDSLNHEDDGLLRKQLAQQWSDVTGGSLKITVPVAYADGTNCRKRPLPVSREAFEVPGYYSLRNGLIVANQEERTDAQRARRAQAGSRLTALFHRQRER